MYILGFSINLLTLFGMVLAIGIVVDDAIVVLENFERIMRTEHLAPRDAAIKAMSEVTGPIVAIVLVLCAVFVPVGFMGGMTGVMYKQFAITIAVSVVISGIVALTLSPALCALIIKPEHKEPIKPFRIFNDWFHRTTMRYHRGVEYILDHVAIALGIFAALLLAIALIYTRLPTGLVPEEDQGYVFMVPMLLPGASLQRTKAVGDELSRRIMKLPETENMVMFAGFDLLSQAQRPNVAASFIILKPWDERKGDEHSAMSFAKRLFGIGADLKETVVIAFNPPPITGISITGGFEAYMQSRGTATIPQVAEMAGKLVEAAKKRPELAGVQTTIAANVPQYDVELDRAKARAANVPIDSVFNTMSATFGAYYVNDFTRFGRPFRVTMASEAPFREKRRTCATSSSARPTAT